MKLETKEEYSHKHKRNNKIAELKISNITILFSCDRPVAAHNERTGECYEIDEKAFKHSKMWRDVIAEVAPSWIDSRPIKEGNAFKVVTSIWPEDFESLIKYEIEECYEKYQQYNREILEQS